MKRRRTKFLSLLLVLAVSFTMVFSSVGFASAATASETKDAFTKTGDYLYKNVAEPSYGSVGGEWVIFGLGSAGYNMSDAYLAAYQKTVESRLTEGYRGTPGILQDRAITDYCRVIMAYTAAGLDVTDVAGYDLLEPFAGKERALWQNMNGPIWVLTALDADKYKIPKLADGAEFSGKAATQNTRQAVINYIVANQLDDGGWDESESKRTCVYHRYDVYGFVLASAVCKTAEGQKSHRPRLTERGGLSDGRRRIYIHQQRWQLHFGELRLGDHGSDGLRHQSVYRYTLHQKRQYGGRCTDELLR